MASVIAFKFQRTVNQTADLLQEQIKLHVLDDEIDHECSRCFTTTKEAFMTANNRIYCVDCVLFKNNSHELTCEIDLLFHRANAIGRSDEINNKLDAAIADCTEIEEAVTKTSALYHKLLHEFFAFSKVIPMYAMSVDQALTMQKCDCVDHQQCPILYHFNNVEKWNNLRLDIRKTEMHFQILSSYLQKAKNAVAELTERQKAITALLQKIDDNIKQFNSNKEQFTKIFEERIVKVFPTKAARVYKHRTLFDKPATYQPHVAISEFAILPVRNSKDWHNEAHRETRQRICRDIYGFMKFKKPDADDGKLIKTSQSLEVFVYENAESLDIYSNLSTLHRRIANLAKEIKKAHKKL
jgi:hypothetical protein